MVCGNMFLVNENFVYCLVSEFGLMVSLYVVSEA